MNYLKVLSRLVMSYRLLIALWFCVLACALAFVLARPVDLASADLGRHLINGQQAVQWLFAGGPSQFLRENTYSYTEPTFPVPNHHWASGAVFWIVYSLTGFVGLSLGYVLLVLCGVGLAVWLSLRGGGWAAVAVVLPLCIPLVGYRAEVRPEVFSFVLVPLVALVALQLGRASWKGWWVVLLLALQLVWVNVHIYFILGPAVVGAFLVDALWRRDGRMVLWYAWCMAGQVLVSLVNPNGLWGAWYPFTIFGNYGYRVLENQTAWFLWGYGIHTPAFWVFAVVLVCVGCALIGAVVRRRTVPVWAVCLACGGVALGLFAVRNLALTAVLVLPVGVWAMHEMVEYAQRRWKAQRLPVLLLGGLLTSAVAFFALYPAGRTLVHGFGVQPGTAGVVEFMRIADIAGPVFNNYDVGGLLIFGAVPGARVFVDNRPEAYPRTFFTDVYVPMQEDPVVFERVDAQYQFRTIVFNYKDATPWAQTFLQRVLQDRQWVPVYVDQAVLVLVRDVPEQAGVIQRYALPRELFSFQTNE